MKWRSQRCQRIKLTEKGTGIEQVVYVHIALRYQMCELEKSGEVRVKISGQQGVIFSSIASRDGIIPERMDGVDPAPPPTSEAFFPAA